MAAMPKAPPNSKRERMDAKEGALGALDALPRTCISLGPQHHRL